MPRIAYLDRARAIGMFLVYYGHFVERAVAIKSASVLSAQWRFIYSFHIPLFFFLAGVFWKPSVSFWDTFKNKLKTRLVPAVFFTLALIPALIVFTPAQFTERALTFSFLTGVPDFNLVVWFLICLMVVELIAALIDNFLITTPLRLAAYSVVFLLVGYYGFVLNFSSVTQLFGVRPNIWYVDDAFIALPFYFAGYLLRDLLRGFENRWGWALSIGIAAAAGYGVWQTYDLNRGEKFWGVLIVLSKYGNLDYFLLTAFLGIFGVVALSRALHFNLPPLNFVGRHSLIYLGLNGLCYHFLNAAIVANLKLPIRSHLDLALYATLISVAQLILFAPLVVALRRYLPELVGMAWTSTSILPPIETWRERRTGAWLLGQMKKYILN